MSEKGKKNYVFSHPFYISMLYVMLELLKTIQTYIEAFRYEKSVHGSAKQHFNRLDQFITSWIQDLTLHQPDHTRRDFNAHLSRPYSSPHEILDLWTNVFDETKRKQLEEFAFALQKGTLAEIVITDNHEGKPDTA